MFTMDKIHRIRELYYYQGVTDLAEIARQENCDWRTVRKYVDKEDFNEETLVPCQEIIHQSKLDEFKPLIDEWLRADRKAPRKQRHTATRVYNRLCREVESFNCSYRLVAEYVSKRKKELKLNQSQGYIPLIHSPGTGQSDFGEADFYEKGVLCRKGKYLVLSFPHSNGAYTQLNYGENLECLMESLQNIFEYIGGVPAEIWFDNTKTIVTAIIKGGGRTITDRFSGFAEHYRFKPVFMNPNSGNEKGNVENKVGYLRRNELVPIPRFEDLSEFNAELLIKCDEDMQREHYDIEKNDKYISELFAEDKMELLPLPSVRFDTALYTDAHTDKYGRFTLNKGMHEYSVSPEYSSTIVQLKITSTQVVVMDNDMKVIVIHRRLYGDTPQRTMNWIPYLKDISRKPRSLKNSGVYDMMPASMQQFMDACSNADKGNALKILAELTDRNGFESALRTVEQAIKYGASDPDSLKTLYNRLYSDVPMLPPLDRCETIPDIQPIPFRNDYVAIDSILQKGGPVDGYN